MNIGIYGGSFNPPHVAHLVVAETVREQFGLDCILWIPSFRPPHKDVETLAPIDDRLEMVRLAISGNDGFAVSDIEKRLGGISYTLSTIERLQEENPDDRFHLIMGGDTLLEFGKWYHPEQIISRVALLVYHRPGADLSGANPKFLEHARLAEAPLLAISAEGLRRRIHAGHSIRYFVPESVRLYIEEHGLYR